MDDDEAQASWINIGVSVLFVSAAAATKFVKAGSAGQEMSKFRRNTNACLKYGTITVCAVSVGINGYGLFNKYRHGGKISKLDIAQMSSVLFLFTHSMSNYSLAEKMLRFVDLGDVASVTQFLYKMMKQKIDDLYKGKASIKGKIESAIQNLRFSCINFI